MTEFVHDVVGVPAPSARTRGLSALLGPSLERLEVGESGVIEARLETVRSLVSRHVRDRRAESVAMLEGHPNLQAIAYTKRFAVRALSEPGKVRVWRVA